MVRNNMIETRFHFQTYIPSIKSLNARYIFIHRIFTERFRVFNLKISGLDSKYSKNSKHKHTLCAFCTYIVPCILSSLEFEKKSIYSIKQFWIIVITSWYKVKYSWFKRLFNIFSKLNSILSILIMSQTKYSSFNYLNLIGFYKNGIYIVLNSVN